MTEPDRTPYYKLNRIPAQLAAIDMYRKWVADPNCPKDGNGPGGGSRDPESAAYEEAIGILYDSIKDSKPLEEIQMNLKVIEELQHFCR